MTRNKKVNWRIRSNIQRITLVRIGQGFEQKVSERLPLDSSLL
jgi:hypothetical protein